MGIEFIKYCKKCKEAYDFGIEYDECPRCRLRLNEVIGDEGKILL